VDALVSGSGEFEQQVEIDDDFEKIVVPAIGDTRKATILHDFNMVRRLYLYLYIFI